MIKKLYILQLLFLIAFSSQGQNIISGVVLDNHGKPLTGVNVYIKNSYDGSTTDSTGHFMFRPAVEGKQILIASFIGFKSIETEINLSGNSSPLTLKFSGATAELNPVVITAGTFEASDTKRSIILKLLDIATTPSAVGDVYGALSTLPGAQIVGDKGGLFVRGGEGYETKTFFDGMQVFNPYFSNMPDLPERGRFSPILFSGTVFSTGGYSAEYGQALSSALILNTTGLAENSQSAVSLMSVGANASHTQRWENSSLALSGMYSNMAPYNTLFKSNLKWEKSPESIDLNAMYRMRRGKSGLLKIYADANSNNSSLYYNPVQSKEGGALISMRNSDLYLNTVYNDQLSGKWRLKTGIAFTRDNLTVTQDTFKVSQPVTAVQQKIVLTYEPNHYMTLKFGEDISIYSYHMDYLLTRRSVSYNTGFTVTIPAFYIESDLRIGKRLALRTGLRSEYVSMMHEGSLVPRISLAYKTGTNSQVAAAYGIFTQRPENLYLLVNRNLESEKATHLLMNYQYEYDNRVLRVECYRKNYTRLVKYFSENNPDPLTYNNSGSGYSQGVDIYWRDSRTVRNLDYWVSCSFIDTKRNYKNYQETRTPAFVSPYTFSTVVKYMMPKLKTHIAVNYTFASTKTWFSPDIPANIIAKTKAYNDLSVNIIYMTTILKNLSVLYFNINNLPGFENVFGYNYSLNPEDALKYTLSPVKPASKRFLVLGLFISIK